MRKRQSSPVDEARQAALEVLLHNARGPCRGLPRTAGWGYPEPYTRDIMLSSLGILASGNEELIDALRRTLIMLAATQSRLGDISSLAHDPHDRGASDTTPLFLFALALYRQVTGETDFLAEAAQRALTWMEYQSPGDYVLVGQLPTSDWRDEQWVLGFGLYVNTLVYAYLRLYGRDDRAVKLKKLNGSCSKHIIDVLGVERPYYPLWCYKVYHSDRFDLLGNSLAILSGLASPTRARRIIRWTENTCAGMRADGLLAGTLPPNLFPYIQPTDHDWVPRYAQFNQPGDYHNGGVWPFISALYVVAVLASGMPKLAARHLEALTELVRPARDHLLTFGFNEWLRAQDGTPQGNDWQTWSAALYLYAVACVERGEALFFDFRTRPILHR